MRYVNGLQAMGFVLMIFGMATFLGYLIHNAPTVPYATFHDIGVDGAVELNLTQTPEGWDVHCKAKTTTTSTTTTTMPYINYTNWTPRFIGEYRNVSWCTDMICFEPYHGRQIWVMK